MSAFALPITAGTGAAELAYVEKTTSVAVTATVEASATDVVSAGALTFDGSTRIKIEFFCPRVDVGTTSGSFVVLNLWEDSTDLGRLAVCALAGSGSQGYPVHAERYLTPSAGTKTYTVKCWRVNSDGTIQPGPGGVGTQLPAFIRITRAIGVGSTGPALLQEIIVPSGGSSTVDFTSIPGTFRQLEMFFTTQTENVAAQDLSLRFNNDSSANYYDETAIFSGTTVASTKAEAATSARVAVCTPTGDAQPIAGKLVIPQYAGAARKVGFSDWGGYYSSESRRGMYTVLWTNTAAITRITLFSSGSSDIKETCVFSLYGVA